LQGDDGKPTALVIILRAKGQGHGCPINAATGLTIITIPLFAGLGPGTPGPAMAALWP
jgi:hypothetical protein